MSSCGNSCLCVFVSRFGWRYVNADRIRTTQNLRRNYFELQDVYYSWIDNSRNVGLIMSPYSTLFIAGHQKSTFSSGHSSRINRTRCAHISWIVYELIFRDEVHVLCREVNFVFYTLHNFQVKMSWSIIFLSYTLRNNWTMKSRTTRKRERELAHTDACDCLLGVVHTDCEGWCDLLHHVNCYR
jgi:hypothetical protein